MFGRSGRDELERDLRRARPEPKQSFVTELSRRIEQTDASRTRRPRRFVIAIAATAVAIVGAGATGGLGHAQTALSGLSGSVAGSVQQALAPAPVTQSESGLSGGTQSAITQYVGAGFYCTRHTSEPDTDKGFEEHFVSSQAEFDTLAVTHEFHRFDGATAAPCNKNNH